MSNFLLLEPTMRRLAALLLIVATPLVAQTQRDSALKLFDQGKHTEALPTLEFLYGASPNDRQVAIDYGFALLGTTAAIPNLDARKALRFKARAAFMRGKALGETSLVVAALIDAIENTGGADTPFSTNAAVDSAMKRGEKAYSSDDLPGALAGYHDALALDPKQYDAALFMGDAFFRMKQIDSSVAWYRNAVAINPDRETAHRYMSDVLIKSNRIEDGLTEAVCAVIAEPFSRVSRQGIVQAANAMHVALGLPLIDLPPRDTSTRSLSAAAYDNVHRAWRGDSGTVSPAFAVEYPGERTYRPSLAEEVAALRAAAATTDTTPTTANIRHLDSVHELEPLIFFTRANAGIAKDYPAYRKTHTFELMMFWVKWAMHKK